MYGHVFITPQAPLSCGSSQVAAVFVVPLELYCVQVHGSHRFPRMHLPHLESIAIIATIKPTVAIFKLTFLYKFMV